MDRDSFFQQLASAKTEAQKSFGDEVMLVEKFVETPRSVQGHVIDSSDSEVTQQYC